MFVEDEIDLWIEEKKESGVQIHQENIDRGQLFKKLNINLSNFVRKRGENVKNFYDFKECIGEGAFGKVFRVICKNTG